MSVITIYGSRIREVNALYASTQSSSAARRWHELVYDLANEISEHIRHQINYDETNATNLSALSGFEARITKVLWLFKVYPQSEMDVSIVTPRRRDFFSICTECGTWDWSHSMNRAYGADSICSDCTDEYYAYNEESDEYHHRYDDREEEVEDDVLSYNADPLEYLSYCQTRAEAKGANPAKPVVYLGIELEVERNKSGADRHINREVSSVLQGTAIVKHDGSLDDGFEVVSAPMTLAYHYGGIDGKTCPWDEFFAGPAKKLKSWLTDTCGIHVHVSRNALTPMHLGKMMVFINSTVNMDFIQRVAGRQLNNWCESDQHIKVQDVLKGPQNGKYVALNLCNANTVELRIFRGNTKKAGFFRCLDFTAAVVDFTRTASLTALKSTDFIVWMNKQRHAYPHLATWLVQTEMLEATRNRIDPMYLSSPRMSHEDKASARAAQ